MNAIEIYTFGKLDSAMIDDDQQHRYFLFEPLKYHPVSVYERDSVFPADVQ